MNKEIKFRIWIESEKRFDYISLNQLLYEDGYYYEHDGTIRNYPVMRYICLEDKNEKDIYEGDYVMVDGFRYEVKFGEHVVDWHTVIDDGEISTVGFYLADILGYPHCFSVNIVDSVKEVVGNIYENSGLLIS